MSKRWGKRWVREREMQSAYDGTVWVKKWEREEEIRGDVGSVYDNN